MPVNLSVRMGDEDLETLDRLVVACRAYYLRESAHMPALAQLARETTRSSALRDLLLAWKLGKADGMFSPALTAAIPAEGASDGS